MKAVRTIATTLMLAAITSGALAQEYVLFNTGNSELPDNSVHAVLVDPSGAKWFGTANGLARFDGSVWTIYNTDSNLAGNSVSDIEFELTSHGPEIWVTTDNGVSVMGVTPDAISVATPYRTDNTDLVSNTVYTAAVDTSHTRWFGTSEGVSSFKGSEWTVWSDEVFPVGIPILAIDYDDEYYYLGTPDRGALRGYQEIDGVTSASPVDTDWSQIASNHVTAICVASDGRRWYGTNSGVSVHTGDDIKSNWIQYNMENEALPGDNINNIVEDSNGAMWICTDHGVVRLQNDGVDSFAPAGITFDAVYSVAEDTDQTFWVGTDAGVIHWIPQSVGVTASVDIPSGVAIKSVYPNPFNPTTTIEFSMDNAGFTGLSVYNLAGQKIRDLVEGELHAGVHQVVWNGRDDSGLPSASGVYIARLVTVNGIATSRMVLMK